MANTYTQIHIQYFFYFFFYQYLVPNGVVKKQITPDPVGIKYWQHNNKADISCHRYETSPPCLSNLPSAGLGSSFHYYIASLKPLLTMANTYTQIHIQYFFYFFFYQYLAPNGAGIAIDCYQSRRDQILLEIQRKTTNIWPLTVPEFH